MNVGQLRQLLKGQPDDLRITVRIQGQDRRDRKLSYTGSRVTTIEEDEPVLELVVVTKGG